MKASEIQVGEIYRMRYWPKVRIHTARVTEVLDDGYFAIEPVELEREYGNPLAYRANNFEKEDA